MTFWDRLKYLVTIFAIMLILGWCVVNGFYMLTTWAF